MDSANEYIGTGQPLKVTVSSGIILAGNSNLICKIKNLTTGDETTFSGSNVQINPTDNTKADVYIDGGILENGKYAGQIFAYFTDPLNPYPGSIFTFIVRELLVIDLLDKVKSEAFIGITHNNHDMAIQFIIDGVILSAIDFMDDEDITEESDLSESLLYRLLKQVAYEYRRRKDSGLSSVNYPDGSVSKFNVEEWLPDVKDSLMRHKVLSI